MVWAIAIASFLGIVVVALLIFFIYSQKEQIRKALNEKRAEKRIPTEVEVELSAAREPLIYEKSSTENASRHGARIFTGKCWRPHDHVLVRLPFGNETSHARVAYCDALPEDAFVVGLYFPSAVDDWLISDSDISDDEGSSQLYRK